MENVVDDTMKTTPASDVIHVDMYHRGSNVINYYSNDGH